MTYKTYDLGNNSVINWRKSVDGYYKGGLAEFKDAPTIRNMLVMTIDYLDKDTAIIESLKGAGEDAGDTMEYLEAFADERAAMVGIRKELEDWLTERKLPR